MLSWDEVQDQYRFCIKMVAKESPLGGMKRDINQFFQTEMLNVYDDWKSGKYKTLRDIRVYVLDSATRAKNG